MMRGPATTARRVASVMVLAFGVSTAHADVVNGSFESGDLTGWTSSSFEIAADGGSHGMFYAMTRSPGVPPPPPPEPGLPPIEWSANISQEVTVPPWATAMAIDLRNDGFPAASFGAGVTHAHEGVGGGLIIDFFASFTRDGVAEPVGHGFTRYTLDISGAAGLDGLGLGIWAGGPWDVPATFSVDNVTFVPGPTATGILLFAGLPLICRRRRRHGG